ncbi:GTPase activating protein (GAP) for Rho1p [Thecaphora frezii]
MAASSVYDDQASTKASLRAWWSAFTKTRLPGAKDKKAVLEQRVFGVPLRQSLKYASVAISVQGDDGQQYVWGYVPVIVAKVGLYLKENATEVEGVFRIAGSQKRMKELQETFDTPPRYGKSVDWSKYSVHDAASVLRRYLNHMPEPIVPLDLYTEFRNVMAKEPFNPDSAVRTYRLLITSMPPANQYLLLYVLDLLAVFAQKSDKNLMPASNLAVLFQPGIISHPSHITSPIEHKLSVEVLEFLIQHQDQFVLGSAPQPTTGSRSDELTAVSKPIEGEDLIQPSDSDEDQGKLVAHEGGGARLMRSLTARPMKKTTSKRRGFGRSSKAVDDDALRASFDRPSTNGTASPEEDEAGEGLAAIVPLKGATGVRRTRTAPTRKATDGASPLRRPRKTRASAGNSVNECASISSSGRQESSRPPPSSYPNLAARGVDSPPPLLRAASSSRVGTQGLAVGDLPAPASVAMNKSATINGPVMQLTSNGSPISPGSSGLPTPPSSKILSNTDANAAQASTVAS